MYVQEKTWHKIAWACSGKHAAECLGMDHGPAVLARNIGGVVYVDFCDKEVISYTVAGRTFFK